MAERPTHAAKNQKEFTCALLRSASGELLPMIDKDLSWKSANGRSVDSTRDPGPNRYSRNSTIPVSRLYIEPAIFMLPLDSRSRSTGLFSRMLAIVSDTFFRATASTNG